MNVEVETQTGQVACPGSCGKVVVKPGWEHENTGIMTPETAHLTMHCCAPITKSSAEKLVELLLFLEECLQFDYLRFMQPLYFSTVDIILIK